MQKTIKPAESVSITKEWMEGRFLRRHIKVRAQQVELPKEYGGLTATAKVTIEVSGKVAHEAEVPWGMPKENIMLALQVYMLAKQPSYASPEWQPIMEKFALACEGFEPPEKMWWSKDLMLD